jgi:DNA topoisomerase-1
MRIPAAWQRLERGRRAEGRRQARMRAAVQARLYQTSTETRILRSRPTTSSSSNSGLDPQTSAKIAGLRHVDDRTLAGIRRVGAKSRMRYLLPNGRVLTHASELQRIRALAIPPAWTGVWICPFPNGHLQATGRDARGRKQYRYHARWREVRDEAKYSRLIAFAEALPAIRRRTDADLRRPGLPREKVLAAVVQLLEKTLIRVGNEEYERENGSFGLTTMKDGHAKISGPRVRFQFRGKSGIRHEIDLDDRRLARIVKACRDLPGQELFQFLDERGRVQDIGSADVNAYLRQIAGQDFTAKDFRTWAGTVLAAQALAEVERFTSNVEARRNVVRAIQSVAKRLGNTTAVCRKCYIHPAILDGYMGGATLRTVKARAKLSGPLDGAERAVIRIIESRLKKTA